jgi:hypothetical protein
MARRSDSRSVANGANPNVIDNFYTIVAPHEELRAPASEPAF